MEREGVILAVDIGNTHTGYAWGIGRRLAGRGRFPTADTGPDRIARLLDGAPDERRIGGIALSCVVPRAEAQWRAALHRACPGKAWWAGPSARLPFALGRYPGVKTLGADRIANASGAVARVGAPVIVVSAGTACTVDGIDPERGFLGGFIVPGPALMLSALARGTALLPALDDRPRRGGYGRDTASAMQRGVRLGAGAMVGALVEQWRAVDGFRRAPVLLTGGAAAAVRKRFGGPVIADRDLALRGLVLLWTLNRNGL